MLNTIADTNKLLKPFCKGEKDVFVDDFVNDFVNTKVNNKFKFNAMKLMKLLEKLLENEFNLHDTRTRTLMPPKPPCFDEVVIRFKFKLQRSKNEF